MSPQRREIGSGYIEWAKLRSKARYHLATSDVCALPVADLHPQLADLEISGSDGYGYAPLLEKLSAKSGVPTENIVHAQGTSMANHLAMAALLEPGDEVLIEEPSYGPIVSTAEYLGATIRRFPRKFESGFELDPREIERNISPRTRLVVLANLHNPSGVRTADTKLRTAGEIARSMRAHVLVDEVYLETCFDSPGRSAFLLAPNFVVTSSLTKAYGLSGLRCGWIFAAKPLAERIWRLNDLFGVMASHPAELLSVLALEHLPEIAARAKKLLDSNRALLKQFFSSRKDLLAIWPESGTIAFPQLISGHADAFCQLLREKYETSVVPGRFFDMPDHFRIGVGGKTEDVREGLSRIAAALDELALKK
ncbi:MAG: aminotransferase class I/II-fold pyridoxal phosphate-dependent enzyme [Candidatus Acidiferrales bacterium]